MPPSGDAGSRGDSQRLRFHCTSCGVLLTIAASRAGTTGPCPKCGFHITAPPMAARYTPAPATARPADRRLKKSARSHKGTVLADTGLDHAHIQNRESLQSLKVLGLFLLTICLCLLIVWLMSL